MDCDLVVLGAGGSGLVAAVKAFDLTGKKVIVLEKSKKPGGATYLAGGMGEAGPIADSTWQKNAGYKVSETPDISGQWFDWICSKGGAETFFKVAKPEENVSSSIYWDKRMEKYKDLPDPSIGPGKMGSWIVDKLVECCQKQGIQLLTEARARKFVTDDKGRLTGVIADTKDGQLLVNCKACVIAAGGYGRNYELLKKYYPKQFNDKKIHNLCPPGATGDCILAAEEIGARIDPTIRSMSFPGGFFGDALMRHPWPTSTGNLLGNGKAVLMNLDGKRWKSEAGMGGGDLAAQPNGVAFAVFDSEILESAGSQMSGMAGPSNDPNSSEAKAQARWREDFEYEIAIDEEGASGNHVKKADNLIDLALKIKIDPRTFVDTIEQYNKYCETGKDLDFGKPAGMLKKINKPPYYAIFGHRWSQCTKGRNGVSVNSKFQALNAKGEVMPGLYAVGDGCTIFGGLNLNRNHNGPGFTAGKGMGSSASSGNAKSSETAAAAAVPAMMAASAAPGGQSNAQGGQGGTQAQGMPSGGQGGTQAQGMPSGGQGGTQAQGMPSGGQGGMPGGGQSGAPGAGGPGGAGGMPMMMGGSQAVDFSKDEGNCCGGLGPAFLSGYYAGMYVADYLKSV
jgi:fumarate reductase flavoprotein subunit